MPDLIQSLLEQDIGYLRIVAENWGISILSGDVRTARQELAAKMLDVDSIQRVIETLPEEAANGLSLLINNQGRLPWSQFSRRFGKVREMGPGRRDRERPDQKPDSVTEVLWYRALISRAFFESKTGAEEFAYIPADLNTFVSTLTMNNSNATYETAPGVLGRVATTAEKANPIFATDRILDHACTLLAGLRIGEPVLDFCPYSLDFMRAVLCQAGIITPDDTPDPDKTRIFLETPRADALNSLAQAWLTSPEVNDLQHVPGLEIEGEWENEPLGTRENLLDILNSIPEGTWWSLSAFIADIRQQHPNFQRPAGDYDSWFIKDSKSGRYLRGFEHWNDVDGALIRYLITGPLHWLGFMDISGLDGDQQFTAFKWSGWGKTLLKNLPPEGLPEENQIVYIRSDGRVGVPVLVPRTVRYQLARFCAWEIGNVHEYRYRLTPLSLSRAREAGLRVSHLVSLLRRYTESLPPNILTALDRWEKMGTQIKMQSAMILRVNAPQILDSLRESRAARYLGDPLSSTAIIVKGGTEEKVLAALVEMGYFGEFTPE
jgi:hypothetical protein